MKKGVIKIVAKGFKTKNFIGSLILIGLNNKSTFEIMKFIFRLIIFGADVD